MLLTDIWKTRMKEVLYSIYGDMVKQDKLDQYLQAKVDKAVQENDCTLHIRNIYKNSTGTIPLNNILNVIEQNNFNILANNAYTTAIKDKMSDVSTILMADITKRKAIKKKIFEYEEKGMMQEAALQDMLQNKVKADINSFYGVSGQEGSLLFSVDSASATTTQARHIISEMMWSFEKLLAGNTQLTSFNEAFLYFNNILKEERHFAQFKDYISYIPDKKTFRAHMIKQLINIKDYYMSTKKISKSLFLFLDRRTEEEMIYLYYKNNLHDFIKLNPKITALFTSILNINESFYNPYDIPASYKAVIDVLITLVEEFVAHHKCTYNRVHKYLNNKRDLVILSDTDSVFLCFQNLLHLIYSTTGKVKNTENDFKLVNSLCALCSAYMAKQHDEFLKKSNAIAPNQNFVINMKNEYYYKRLIIYTNIVKNYSGYILLREGKVVPEKKQISSTGIKLTSGKIPKVISNFQEKIISEYILKADTIDPIAILNELTLFRAHIASILKSGDKSLGLKIRYSGKDGYKKKESNETYLLVETFQRLYPAIPIQNGDALMKFNTIVTSEKDLDKIKDDRYRQLVKDVIFCDTWDNAPNILKNRGLKTIAIPLDGDMFKTPDWIIDILDIRSMCDYHLQSIITILPSIGIKLISGSNDKKTYSNLVSF